MPQQRQVRVGPQIIAAITQGGNGNYVYSEHPTLCGEAGRYKKEPQQEHHKWKTMLTKWAGRAGCDKKIPCTQVQLVENAMEI